MATTEFDRVRHWSRVVDGSQLSVVVVGTTEKDKLTAVADWLDSTAEGDEAVLDTVKGKAFLLPLQSPRTYSVDLLLSFVTKAEATVSVRVLKPGGAVHGKPYEVTFTAAAKANEFFSFFVMTSKE